MIRTLNSLRFFLILMIVISHSTLPIPQGLKDCLGECPVSIFFIISGFVLSLSKGEMLEKGELNNKQFFLSRILKLYPLHLGIIAITLPLDWRLGHLVPWYQILAQALLIQCWYPSHDFGAAPNAPTWFLSDIIFFYLIFKYLYRWIIKNSWRKISPAIGIYMLFYLILATSVKNDYSSGYIYIYPTFRMIDFCIGILLYKFCISSIGKRLFETISHHLTAFQSNLTAILIIFLLYGTYELSLNSQPNIRCAALYWLPSAIIVFYIASADKSKGWLIAILHNKQLLWLGGISFEIFLCHSLCYRIVQSIFLRIYGEDIPILGGQFCISLAQTILVAWIAKKYIVMPIYNKYKNH